MEINDKKFIRYVKNLSKDIKNSEFKFMASEAKNIIKTKEITPSNVLHLVRILHYNINLTSTYKEMMQKAVYSRNPMVINKCLRVKLEHEYMYKVLSNVFTWEIIYNGDNVEAIIEYKNKEVA